MTERSGTDTHNMTSTKSPAFEPTTGLRLGTTFVLVALAHVLVIVLLLSHFGWPGSADSEGDTDSISGQSGIVIPVTLEKAKDPEPVSTTEPEAKAESKLPSAPQPDEETTQRAEDKTEPDKEIVHESDPDATPEPALPAAAAVPAPAEPRPSEPPPAPTTAPATAPVTAPSTSIESSSPSTLTNSSTSGSGSGPALMSEQTQSHPETPAQVDPNYLHRPNPVYPALSRRLREEGTVVLRVSLDARGTVQDIAIQTSSNFERLDQAALEAVRQWRFIPATRGQVAVPSTVLVPIAFRNQ